MKLNKFPLYLSLIGSLALSVQAQAEYRFNYRLNTTMAALPSDGNSGGGTAPETPSEGTWALGSPIYSDWTVSGAATSCQTWLPDMFTLTVGTYPQTANDCAVNKTRTKQNIEVNSVTGETRNVGEAVEETSVFNDGSSSRSLRIQMTPLVTLSTTCESWTPDPSTVERNNDFTQTGTNCTLQQQKRVRGAIDGGAIQVFTGPTVVSHADSATQSAKGTAPHLTYPYKYYPNGSVLDWTPIFTGIGSGKPEDMVYNKAYAGPINIEAVSVVEANPSADHVIGQPYVVSNGCLTTAWECNFVVDAPLDYLENGVWKKGTILSNPSYFGNGYIIINLTRAD